MTVAGTEIMAMMQERSVDEQEPETDMGASGPMLINTLEVSTAVIVIDNMVEWGCGKS